MAEYFLGIDIGASSGRHILAHMEKGKMILEEVHRFPNGMSKKDGELCWDTKALFHEIKLGMRKCAELGKIPVSVGIDTWAVDFVLLDEQDEVIVNTVCYRDSRTQALTESVHGQSACVICKRHYYMRFFYQISSLHSSRRKAS